MLKQMAMVLATLILAAGFSLQLAGCSKDTGWSSVADDNPEIVAAREEARANYPEFVKLLKTRIPGAIYNAEVLYEEGEKSEYLSIDVASATDTEIEGMVLSYPKEVGVLHGAIIKVPVANLSDWSVDTAEGDTKGGYVSKVRARLQRAGG